MFITKIKRVFIAGLTNFWRNGFVSLSSLVVMFITLFMICLLIFTSAILKFSLQEIKNKVDVNVYFNTNAGEAEILSLSKSIQTLPEIDKVEYLSKEQVLLNFEERWKDNGLVLGALKELGENPFGSQLNIKAKDPAQYEGIVGFFGLKGTDCKSFESKFTIIEKINYCQNKVIIDNLVKITNTANAIGFWISVLLLIISIIITFNTIRLAIFISKDEISLMRLVGASGRYIRGPFVVSGILYGIVSSTLVMVVFFGLTYWLGNLSENLGIGLDLFDFYLKNFAQIFLIIFGSGSLLGAVSSYLAVRRYLKI